MTQTGGVASGEPEGESLERDAVYQDDVWRPRPADANREFVAEELEETATSLRRAELVAEACTAELAFAVEGASRLRSELEATRSELEATRSEANQLRLPAARYARLRALIPTPMRRLLMAGFRALTRTGPAGK